MDNDITLLLEIKSSVSYPCATCDRNGKRACVGIWCQPWLDWFKGGAWSNTVKTLKGEDDEPEEKPKKRKGRVICIL